MTKVKLIVPSLNMSEEFAPEHAEKLLRKPNNGGWELPKDSVYSYTKKDGLTIKPNKGNSQKPKEQE